MNTYFVGFVVGVVLFAGIAEVGRRRGPNAEKRLERAFFVALAGLFVGVILLGLIWTAFSDTEAAPEQSIARTLGTVRPAIDDYRAAADRYVESSCADDASMSGEGEPTEAELLCPAGIVLDARWVAVLDPMVEVSTEASPACYERLLAAIQQVNVVDTRIRRTGIEVAAADRPGEASAAMAAMDRAFSRLDAAYASARAACRED